MSIPSALHDRRYDPLDPTASFAAAAAHLFEAFAHVAFDPNMAHAPTVSEAEVAALGAPVAELAPAESSPQPRRNATASAEYCRSRGRTVGVMGWPAPAQRTGAAPDRG